MKLIEIRQGLFVNFDHVVCVRVLPEPEGAKFAVLQLSNGENQNITREEFAAIVGSAPRLEGGS